MALPTPKQYWNFNETSGTTATDSISGAKMTIDRADSFRPGKVGTGLRFNPNDGAKKVSTSLPEVAPPWTVGLWVLREAASNGSSLLSGGKAALKLEQWGSGGVLGFTEYSYGQPGFGGDYTLGSSAPLGQWVHLTYVGTSAGTSLYVNGQLAQTDPHPIILGLDWIGSSHGSVELASMILDELKIFNEALDPTQIKELYDNGEPQIYVSENGSAVANNSNVALGSATIGGPGLTKTFTITNTGNASLNLTGIGIDNSSDYILNPTSLNQVLQKGATATFSVTFAPKTATPGTATVTITSNDPKVPSYRFTLSGSSTAAAKPQIEVSENGRGVLSSSSVTDFGNQVQGGSRIVKSFTITNRGNDPLRVDQVYLSNSGAFTLSPSNLAQTLYPGQSAAFSVTFAPTGAMNAQAEVLINSNDTGHSPFSIKLTGRSVGSPHLIIKQHPSNSLINNGQNVAFIPMAGVTAIHVVIQNSGDTNLVLDHFSTSFPGAWLDAGGRNLAGSAQGLISYGNRSAADSQTTFSIIPGPGIDAAQLNGTRISFRTNDPNYPEFSFTISGFGSGGGTGGGGYGGGNPGGGYGGGSSGGGTGGGAWQVASNPQGQGHGSLIGQGSRATIPGSGVTYIEVMPPEGSWNNRNVQSVQLVCSGAFAIVGRAVPAVPTQAVVFSVSCSQRGAWASAQILYNGSVVHSFEIMGQ